MRQAQDNPRLNPRVNGPLYKDPVRATHVDSLTLVPRGLWFLPSIPRTTMRSSVNGVSGLDTRRRRSCIVGRDGGRIAISVREETVECEARVLV